MEIDLLNVDPAEEQVQHKLKQLVQAPESFFMDVKCPQCQHVNTIFSHPSSVCLCSNCKFLLCIPKGGKGKLAVGTAWRKKGNWELFKLHMYVAFFISIELRNYKLVNKLGVRHLIDVWTVLLCWRKPINITCSQMLVPIYRFVVIKNVSCAKTSKNNKID